MRTSTLLILTAAAMVILASAAIYLDSIARPELTAAARFSIQAAALAVAFGLVIALIAWGWIAYERARIEREKRLEAAARRRQAERDANLTITVAPAGSQVYAHESGYDIYHKPLHLAPGRVNGIEVEPSPVERQAWAFYQLAHGGRAGSPPALPGGDAYPALSPGFELPNLIRLADLLPGGRGDMNNLILGVRINEAGNLERVTISLHDLFHTIVAASSGWGKSAFVTSTLAQLATSPDPVELVLIDQQEHGLAAFKQCDRLRYPLLSRPAEILSALKEIYTEAVQYRAGMLARVDADNLAEYNQRSDHYLPPIIVGVDEASALLSGDKEIGAELKRQAWELRKFGVYQILCLTSAKGTTIDTDHRQQFSSKVQLHANDKGQARLLMDAIEAVNFPPGRAAIELPQQAPVVVQTPYIDKREARSMLRPGGPPPAPREWISDESAADSRFVELVGGGMSRRQAALEAYGSEYAGAIVTRGKRALGEI